MKIWYDALTGKHLRYAVAIAERLQKSKHEIILTTRKHPDTLPLASFLKKKFIVIGRYDTRSLLTRTEEGARRQLAFCKLFGKEPPDIAISHGSVDLCRTAFGLGKPIITTIDTPYAEAVHRLTLPLSSHIIASAAIPKRILDTYNVKAEIARFAGVDEVAWIKNFKPTVKYDYGKPLIVVRQFEEKAVYSREVVNMLDLAKGLTRLGTVVFLSRYERKAVKGLIVPKEFIDSASLASQADLIVGVGGTITREAALQGTPAIIVEALPKQHVNDFLIERGFPIFKAKPSSTLSLAKKLLGKKYNVKHLLDQLENPLDIIENVVNNTSKSY
ncbi:DUF354 domain-containing protein [Candidatus Bathyarchaeota archaeon]|nr:DUF354 domain-containing protein [Candidatus Bathyarchaeota archaeon]